MSVVGEYPSKREMFTKVRRGGPWSQELGLYYKLLGEDEICILDDKQARRYQQNMDQKSDEVNLVYSLLCKIFRQFRSTIIQRKYLG